jgi:ribosomal protein S27AE
MRCPGCGAEYTELKSVAKVKDSVNEYGRREIVFVAEHDNPVTWENDHYHCKRCGLNFSFTEGVMQKLQNNLGD